MNILKLLAGTQKSVSVEIDDKEMPFTLQNGLPPSSESLIEAFEALKDEALSIIYDFLKSTPSRIKHSDIQDHEPVESYSSSAAVCGTPHVTQCRPARLAEWNRRQQPSK